MAISTFVRHPVGFDKTLRLVQALSQIAMTFPDMARWSRVRDKLAFVRRFNRMFNWIDCWRIGQASQTASYLESLFATKDTLMGIYLFMEMWTIPWVLSLVANEQRGKDLEIEANKFWFYSLCVALVWDLWQLWTATPASKSTASKNGDKKESKSKDPSAPAKSTWRLYRRLVADACDVVLPAGVVGWLALDTRIVGGMMVVSTVAAGWEVWERL